MSLEPGAYTPEQLSEERYGQPYRPEVAGLKLGFDADKWTPDQVEEFKAEFERQMAGGTHTRVILPAAQAPDPVTHIAGTQVQVGSRLRQRCSWCGMILADYDLGRIAVPEGQDSHPAMWEPGRLVRVDGIASFVVEHEDGTELPDDACACAGEGTT